MANNIIGPYVPGESDPENPPERGEGGEEGDRPKQRREWLLEATYANQVDAIAKVNSENTWSRTVERCIFDITRLRKGDYNALLEYTYNTTPSMKRFFCFVANRTIIMRILKVCLV